ncbi:uncharacterized protein JCM10292_003949 [Rhodotorula paludigena]|uniref:uncharacterized protein n=1 Tax=Rhodotorula paludigena TaxID=86838 RepID=UPI003173D5D9
MSDPSIGDPSTAVVNLDSVTGPVVMGSAAAVLLYGVLLSQFTRYLQSPGWHRSTWPNRIAILVVMVFVTTAVALSLHDIWYYGTLASLDLDFVLSGTAAQGFEPFLCGIVAFMVQTMLVLRVLKVLDARWLRYTFVATTVGAALFSCLSACFYGGFSVAYHYDSLVNTDIGLDWNGWYQAWLWTAAAVDVNITSIYIFAINRRLGDGAETTRSVMRLVLLSAIRSAAYTAIVAIIAAITAQVFKLDDPMTYLICYAFWEPLPPIYALSLFTTLSIADNVVARLSDPILRRVGDANMHSGLAPQFVGSKLSCGASHVSPTGGRRIELGTASWNEAADLERGQAIGVFGEEDERSASPVGVQRVTPPGICVKVEKTEQEDV